MRKLAILMLIMTLILAVVMLFTISSQYNFNYIKIPEYTHSHTKAICTSENFCQDYEIFCKEKEAIKIIPITGAAVQFPENWHDPRSPELRSWNC